MASTTSTFCSRASRRSLNPGRREESGFLQYKKMIIFLSMTVCVEMVASLQAVSAIESTHKGNRGSRQKFEEGDNHSKL